MRLPTLVHARKFMWVPIILLIICLIFFGVSKIVTGEFVHKGISLKGGTTITAQYVSDMTASDVTQKLQGASQVKVRSLNDLNTHIGYIIETNIVDTDEKDLFVTQVRSIFPGIIDDHITVEVTGSSLGSQFFKQTLTALITALIFMGIVVFVVFRTIVPSAAIMAAVVLDLIITLGIYGMLGQELSSAAIAALLMIVGYAVDTNILLSSTMLKRGDIAVSERYSSALKTGLMMTATTLVAICVGLMITNSDIIRQIMIILVIGLLVDAMNTWILNASILKRYLQKRGDHA
ncbi:MAG: preprotein translocase subunit SecF [Candidatus Woesearchaeota archaeon]|jgi:preprotein translocase subunit SecF